MAPRVSKTSKIALLKLIQAKRGVLFGKFSSDLDNREKHLAWTEVLLKAKSLEIVSSERDAAFVRDKVYGVWKSRALEKRDNMQKTGAEGGRERVLDDVDKLILDIVGIKSVAMDGLPVGESGAPMSPTRRRTVDLESEDEEGLIQRYESGGDRVTSSPTPQPSTSTTAPPSQQSSTSHAKAKNYLAKRKQKGESEEDSKRKFVQCSLMDIKIYKCKLECLKLERELEMPPSSFTNSLFE